MYIGNDFFCYSCGFIGIIKDLRFYYEESLNFNEIMGIFQENINLISNYPSNIVLNCICLNWLWSRLKFLYKMWFIKIAWALRNKMLVHRK